MRQRHSSEEILRGAIAVAEQRGLSSVSFGVVGRHLGVSDRTVVYYFPTKTDLVAAVLRELGDRLRSSLEEVIRPPFADHRALVAQLLGVLSHPDHDRLFGLFFEASGLAAVGKEPYADLVPAIVEGWVTWAAELIDAPSQVRLGEARAAVTLADGLLLFARSAGVDAALDAATHLGVAATNP